MPSPRQHLKVYKAKRLGDKQVPAIGGRGSGVAWHEAHVLTEFAFPWSTREAPATEFRALWNRQFLFFRFNVVDTDVVLGDGASPKAKVIGSDRVEIFFSTGPDLNPYYGIEIDPRGEVLDYEARYHRQMNWDWSCEGLVVNTSLVGTGYDVEGAIPISTLRKLNCFQQDEAGDYLIAGLYRAEFSHGGEAGTILEDWISWIDPEVESPDFHVPSSFGVIRLND